MSDPRNLRDPELSARLRKSLSSQRPPARWVDDAMSLAPRPATSPRRVAPWLLDVLPQAAGVALVLAFGVTLLLHPELLPRAGLPSASWLPDVHPGLTAPLMASVPALLLLLVEGSRGFPHLRRWLA